MNHEKRWFFCLQKTSTSTQAKLSLVKKLCLHRTRNWVKDILRAFVKSQCCKYITQIIYTFSLAFENC